MTVTLNLVAVVWVAGAIVTVASAIAIIYKVVNKVANTEKIKLIKDKLDRDEKRLDDIDQDIKEIKSNQKVMMHSVYVLLEHFATNNGKEEIKKELDRLVEYVATKQ